MKVQLLRQCCDLVSKHDPLEYCERPVPVPTEGELLLRVTACGVCHTELDEVEGRMPPPRLPVIPGHQVVGKVTETGEGVTQYRVGDRVGVAWIYSACGQCALCENGLENLCHQFRATGRDADGGYAQYMKVPEQFAHPIPDTLTDVQVAPLLCAGAIGYRSLRLSGLRNGQLLGLTGFGGSGHLVLHLVRCLFPDSQVFVFARAAAQRQFALELGAAWSGTSGEVPPERLDAIIDTTPAWKPVLDAMEWLVPGGRLVINAIRKENHDRDQLLQIDYPRHLWMEKEIKSVANVCRSDVREFLQLAAQMDIKANVTCYPLSRANQALYDLKTGNVLGAKVLTID